LDTIALIYQSLLSRSSLYRLCSGSRMKTRQCILSTNCVLLAFVFPQCAYSSTVGYEPSGRRTFSSKAHSAISSLRAGGSAVTHPENPSFKPKRRIPTRGDLNCRGGGRGGGEEEEKEIQGLPLSNTAANSNMAFLTKVRRTIFPIFEGEVQKFLMIGSIKFFIILALTLTRDLKDTLIVTQCGAEAIAFLKVCTSSVEIWGSTRVFLYLQFT